jgi:hypothetical protein
VFYASQVVKWRTRGIIDTPGHVDFIYPRKDDDMGFFVRVVKFLILTVIAMGVLAYYTLTTLIVNEHQITSVKTVVLSFFVSYLAGFGVLNLVRERDIFGYIECRPASDIDPYLGGAIVVDTTVLDSAHVHTVIACVTRKVFKKYFQKSPIEIKSINFIFLVIKIFMFLEIKSS